MDVGLDVKSDLIRRYDINQQFILVNMTSEKDILILNMAQTTFQLT